MNSVAISDSPWPAKPFPIFFRSLAVDGLGDVFAESLLRVSDASGVEELGFSLLRFCVGASCLRVSIFENGLYFVYRFPRSVCFSSPIVAARL